MNVSEEQEESCCHDRNVQRGEVPRQLEALYFVLVTKSVEKPSGGSGVAQHNQAIASQSIRDEGAIQNRLM